MPRFVSIMMLCVPLFLGCAVKQKKIEYTLDNPAPINCATAEGDLRVLQSEKTHAGQRIAEGVAALAPAGAALCILTTTERTKFKVASGEYNKKIDERIAQIRSQCDL